jgi:hypothetical protein
MALKLHFRWQGDDCIRDVPPECARVCHYLPQERAMKKLEMKDLTEAEKAEITLLLQKAQANADHTLTNGERNKIREEGRLQVAAERAKVAKVASALAREKAKERAKNQVLPDTFSWIDSVSNKFRSKR